MKEVQNPLDTPGFYVIPEFIQKCDSIEEFEELYKNDYGIKEIISTNARDINITTDKGYIVLFGKKYAFTDHAANELCKLLKIPYAFTKKISLTLLNINIDELKKRFLEEDKEIEFIILDVKKEFFVNNNPDNVIEGIITNIVRKQSYAERYLDEVITTIKNGGKKNNMEFLKGYISFGGFQLYCLNKESKDIEAGEYTYTFGQCFTGDYYKINKHLKLEVFALNNETNDTIYMQDKGIQSIPYLLKSKKPLKEEYIENLRDNIIEDFGIYKESELFGKYMFFAEKHNISYASFLNAAKDCKKLFGNNAEYVHHLFGLMEKDNVLAIQETLETIKNFTPKVELVKKLLTTGIAEMNIQLVVTNLMHSIDEMISMGEREALNLICLYLLDENFQCNVQ